MSDDDQIWNKQRELLERLWRSCLKRRDDSDLALIAQAANAALKRLDVVEEAGFRFAKSLAHPFLGPTSEDQLTLWCKECSRDSGFHYERCSKSR